MRFLNRPHKVKYGQEPKIIPLNFVDHQAEPVKQALTGIPVDTQELIEALNFVIHGVAIEETRPVLNCVCFDCSKNTLQLVTADGFRLPIATMKVKGMTKKQALIHRLDIPKLLTFLKNNYTGKGKSKAWLDTYLDIREQKTMFISDKGMVEFDNQTGSYPNYSQLVPDKGTHIQVIASEMLEAVKALKHIADDGSGIIRLKFDLYPSKVTLSAKSEELGESQAECQAMVDKECYIACNIKYLTDFLSTCKDNVIDLFVDKPSSPMVIYKNQEQCETIMPMYINWE
jgi:DNA polymerase III sliding clamp (beta) subunit (PCNA family)